MNSLKNLSPNATVKIILNKTNRIDIICKEMITKLKEYENVSLYYYNNNFLVLTKKQENNIFYQ